MTYRCQVGGCTCRADSIAWVGDGWVRVCICHVPGVALMVMDGELETEGGFESL